MTLQDIFNTVVTHLYTQQRVSRSAKTAQCAYRGDWGSKCAIGCLIPDAVYRHHLEGRPVMDSAVQRALTKAGVLTADAKQDTYHTALCFLRELQTVHDCFYACAGWPWARTAVKLAERGNHRHLTWPEGVPHA